MPFCSWTNQLMKAMIVTSNGKYKLKKNLPGQRNAAAQGFKGFCAVARDYGMVQDVMQPTMMKREKKANDEASGRLSSPSMLMSCC